MCGFLFFTNTLWAQTPDLCYSMHLSATIHVTMPCIPQTTSIPLLVCVVLFYVYGVFFDSVVFLYFYCGSCHPAVSVSIVFGS